MKLITFVLSCLIVVDMSAQGAMTLSLQQALELAGEQAYAVRTSALEAEKAEKRLKEIVGLGLPQINGSAGLSDYLDIPVQVSENFFGGSEELVQLQFGLRYSANVGIQLDQLIFDGSYIVGLQASRAFRDSKQQELLQSIHDAKAAGEKAYYAVLVAREGVKNLESLIPVLEENVRQVTGLFDNGFADVIDVQRQELGLSELRNQLIEMKNQEASALDMLHFVLGLPLNTPLTLTDGLDLLLENPDPRALAQQSFSPDSHVDSRVAESLIVMQGLNTRNEKAAALPKLYGFFSHQQSAYRREFDVFSSGSWFPTTLWGVNLQIPIFSGGVRYNKVKQSQIAYEQVLINQELVLEQLALEVAQKQKSLLAAAERYDNETRNLELAQSIFDRTNTKFREGVATSFELTEERSQLLNKKIAYIQSLADLLLARADMIEALGIY